LLESGKNNELIQVIKGLEVTIETLEKEMDDLEEDIIEQQNLV